MYNYNVSKSYGYQVKRFFAYGLSKIIDIGDLIKIDYPKYLSNSKADSFDSDMMRQDFEFAGGDLRKTIDDYTAYSKHR